MQRDTNKQKNMAAASGNEPRAQLLRTDRPLEDSVANENRRKTRAFLRFALGASAEAPQGMEERDWKRLYRFGWVHAILGVVFDGMNRLQGMGAELPEDIVEKTVTTAMSIEKRNKKVNRAAVGLVCQLEADGFRCCLLKGQGNNLLYPHVYSRMPGDIDIWVTGPDGAPVDIPSVIRYARSHTPGARAVYHHIDYGCYEGVDVELHYRPSFMTNPVHNRRLQQWFVAQAAVQCAHRVELPGDAGSVPVPTLEFNAVYQLAHIYTHLLNKGFGMRHVIDYYYVLMALTDRSAVRDTLKKLGMERIAGAMMWVLRDLFDLPEDRMVATPDKRTGRALLKDVLRSGNFGRKTREKGPAPEAKSRRMWQLRLKMNYRRLQRDLRMLRYFPSECLCEPVFRLYHFFWRLIVGRNF